MNEKDLQSVDTEPSVFSTKPAETDNLEYVRINRVVRTVVTSGQNGAKYLIFCPGCNCCHGWNDRWTFNGNLDCPTVSPSLLVTHLPNYDEQNQLVHNGICHSFIRNGNIEFLSDCTHKLAGQTVKLKPF